MKTKEFTRDSDRATDIESVNYYSDGKTLNAILWLYFPFNPSPTSYEDVNYGMYIDSDFDDNTGFGGIDYKVELNWNNDTKRWTKIFEKWSHFGEALVLENQTILYSDFSRQDGEGHYVQLSANLEKMLAPEKYKVVFYGEVRKEDDGALRTDFTRMIAVPPLELSLSISPDIVELRKGEEKTIEVKISTVQGYEPTVNLHARSQSDSIIVDFTGNDTTSIPISSLRIPSYGVATTPMSITTSEDASTGPYTLFIFANSSFPPEELIRPPSSQEIVNSNFLPSSVKTIENIFSDSTVLLTVQEPLTIVDNISDFWNKIGSPISFVYGVLAGLIPWVYSKVRDYKKNQIKKDT
jgi:hypothetical protein